VDKISFRLVAQGIPASPPVLPPPGAGATVTFEGIVRDHNEGRKVLRLEYSAYPRLAQSEVERILDEAVQEFGLLRADCVHRIGPLEIGECAVKVWVAAAHRREAFAGCAYIMDQIKSRVPIWKRELYADGDCQWVGCSEAHRHAGPAT